MTYQRKTSPFTQHDVTRALNGAQKAGVDVGSFEITKDGTMRITALKALSEATKARASRPAPIL